MLIAHMNKRTRGAWEIALGDFEYVTNCMQTAILQRSDYCLWPVLDDIIDNHFTFHRWHSSSKIDTFGDSLE